MVYFLFLAHSEGMSAAVGKWGEQSLELLFTEHLLGAGSEPKKTGRHKLAKIWV